MAAGFFLISDTLTQLLQAEHVLTDAKAQADEFVPRIEQAARQNAPWSDRTGEARAGLVASSEVDGTDIIINLAHSVDYGIWLETIQSGRFAIIMPTLEQYAGAVFHTMGAVPTGESLG